MTEHAPSSKPKQGHFTHEVTSPWILSLSQAPMKPLLLFLAVITSCAPTTPVVSPFVKQTLPAKAADVSPAIDAAREAAAKADAAGDLSRERVTAITRETTTLRQGLQSATAEADRLRKQKTASETELDHLWQSLQALTARNLFLESETQAAADSLALEKSLRLTAGEALTTAQALARGKENETTQLRLQLIDSESQREAIHATNSALAKATSQHQSRADKLTGEIRLYRIALGIAALLILLWLIIKFLLPPRLL